MPSAPTKVVFLIDERSLIKRLITIDSIKLSIMRTLLFYHSQQIEVLWGFRFFNTQVKYTADSIRRFYTMNEESFNAIEVEYNDRERARSRGSVAIGSPFMRIKQLLREAIGDFQWENTDLCAFTPSYHYMYILTACPANLKDINLFFVSPIEDDIPLDSSPSLYPPYFQQAKDNLSEFIKIYNERQISISIIDTDFKYPLSNPNEQLVSRIIKRGFESVFGQFGGTYILFNSLIRNYNIYGHSFISEFTNILPRRALKKGKREMACQIPAWKGPFKTRLGKSIGNFVLFPYLRNGSYQTSTLAFISEIRTINVIHASQLSTSWILNESGVDPDHDYKLTYEEGETPHLFNTVLDELYARQSILIAELIPMIGYEQLSRKVAIEPFSRSSASLRFLSLQHMPNTIQLQQMKVDEDHPVGNFISGTNLQINLPLEIPSSDKCHFKMNMDVPTNIKKVLQLRKSTDAHKDKSNSGIKGKEPMRSVQQQQEHEEQIERAITLPADVNMMGKALKKLYFELLYTQNDTVENTLTIIDQWINHLLKNNYTKGEILTTLFDYTMPFEDLDVKHNNEIPQAANQRPTGQITLEQSYLYEWWHTVKTRGASDSKYEKSSCTVLKLKEARLQVILYCFITRLVIDMPSDFTKRDPCEQAERFFKRIVLLYSYHDITDFLTETDSEDGPEAVKKRDPADLNDFVFMSLLEKCFNDLPDLTNSFKEAVGMDELASQPASPASVQEEDYQEVDPPSPQEIIQKAQRPKPMHSFPRPTQFDRPPVARSSQSDHNVRKTGTPIKLKPSGLPINSSKSAKVLLPVKMQRANSNNTLDLFMKRQVDVKSSNVTRATESSGGNATEAAIAKVHRSAVNGRPTMKRTGSFTKSAQSPKRAKRSTSVLSHGETGTVVLRRETIPNPQITPRTSMNRFLGTNIFDDYSEVCMSPSKTAAAAEEEAQFSRNFLQSAYPQVPKTPQGTPHRYRKVMMNHTPRRDAGDVIADESEFSVLRSDERDIPQQKQQKHPPYTPRTAARRERDRIDRSEIPLGRNLTSAFQNMLEEEKQQEKPRKVRSIFDDDEKDQVEEKEINENINPFRSSSTADPVTTTHPTLKKTRTIDKLFEDSEGEEDEEDKDSDSDLGFPFNSQRSLF